MKLLLKTASRIILLFLVLAVVISAFINNYNNVLGDMSASLRQKSAAIKRYVDLSAGFLDLLTVHANNYLRQSVATRSHVSVFVIL